MDPEKKALDAHRAWRGKIRVTPNACVETKEDLSLAYTPGVAAACRAIEKDPDEIVRTVTALAPSFGGINLADISAPR